MGLLDKLENKIAKHPLVNETYEIKISYLNAIAFFISIDDRITEAEKKNFDKIIVLLDCKDVKDDLYEFLENPDLDEFENTFKFINEKGYFITYLLEVFYLIEHTELNNFESRFINMIIDMFHYTKDEIKFIFEFVKNIKENNDEKIINSFDSILSIEKLYKERNKFYTFYKLSHNVKNKFLNLVKQKEINIKILLIDIQLIALRKTIKKRRLSSRIFNTKKLKKELKELEKEKKICQKEIDKLN